MRISEARSNLSKPVCSVTHDVSGIEGRRNTFSNKIGRVWRSPCSNLPALVILALILLHASPVCAQRASASLNGIVTDPTAAVVDEATITLTAVDTGVVRTTISNRSGAYVFVNVVPTIYTLNVAKEGFS